MSAERIEAFKQNILGTEDLSDQLEEDIVNTVVLAYLRASYPAFNEDAIHALGSPEYRESIAVEVLEKVIEHEEDSAYFSEILRQIPGGK